MADDTNPPTPPTPTGTLLIHILLQLLAATLSSLIAAGVFPIDSTGLKIATIIAANLAALGYGQQAAKTAAIRGFRAALRASHLLVLGLGVGAIAGVMVNVSCAGAAKPLATFGSCSVSSLEADIGNGTLLDAVKAALATDDYEAAAVALIAKVGEQEVACAVLAIDEVLAPPAGAVAHAELPGDRIVRQHADALIAKRGWRGVSK